MKKFNPADCVFIRTNLRPSGLSDKPNSDCGARSVAFALNGESSYADINNEQIRYSNVSGYPVESIYTYERPLRHKNWIWVVFNKPMSRAEVAVRLNNRLPEMTALTLSLNGKYVAPVRGGGVFDIKDSRRQKVFAMLVPYQFVNEAIWAIDLDGYTQAELGEMECSIIRSWQIPVWEGPSRPLMI